MKECPLFEAFCEESLRISTPIPSGPPRVSFKDIRCVKLKNKSNWIVDYCENKTKWYDLDGNIGKKKKNNNIEFDYVIPATWNVSPNMAYFNMSDKTNWNLSHDTMELNLNYWLKRNDETGKVRFSVNNEGRSIASFSVGKRDCLGQSLARKQFKCFLANLMLNYKISAVNDDCQAIKFDYVYKAVTSMQEIAVNIVKR